MTKLTCHAAGRGVKRVQQGETIVGFLLQMANGRWGLYSDEEKRLVYATYESHQDAFKAFPAALAAHNAKVQA